jgi:TonB-linked SusC/RagA family outer membrane protein
MKSPKKYTLPRIALCSVNLWQKRKILSLFTAFIFSVWLPVLAQESQPVTVSGTVTDASGTNLDKTTVTEKGTKNATTTDASGRFTIKVAGSNAVLIITSIGYDAKQIKVNNQTNLTISLDIRKNDLDEVVVVGYGSRKKESITGAISNVTAKDLDRVHAGSTVSAGLAGKIPGVTFRMPDGRPGASANIQIRNMGNPLYVIDGIQQDAGQFNNIAPNDVESITVLKDAAAAIYGVRAANGVLVVTTKRGKGGPPSVNVDAFYGGQNWSRFPKVLSNSYDYMRYKADAEMNGLSQSTAITPAELERYKTGTELGYQSFDWRKFIIKANAPLTSVNLNITGGNENVKYYISATRLDQNSVLGREYKFGRSNIQSNLDAKITKRFKIGIQINGRLETRTNPGVPGGDDYFLPRFAILRNLPTERPYANDNPEYLNTIGQNDANWGFINYKNAGKFFQEWRVLQTNGDFEYQIPGVKGLSLKGIYSYYIADLLYNNQEYTYKTYTYRPATTVYEQTGGSINPWREKEQVKQINVSSQVQLAYNAKFGNHNIDAVVVNERISNQRRRNWVRSIPPSNALSLVYFSTLADYQDTEDREARIGYIGRVNYNYANKYFLEVAARRDASQLFRSDKRVGYFPSASVGWRITKERFMNNFLGGIISDLKIRASYGSLGDDRREVLNLEPFSYIDGYTYGANGVAIIAGQPLTVSRAIRNGGVPIVEVTWLKSNIFDIGADFSLFNGKISGSFDRFSRKRSGLVAPPVTIPIPSELGYVLPLENLEIDGQYGQEGSLSYTGKVRKVNFNVGVNLSYSRSRFLKPYKPTYFNSLDKYRNSRENRLDRISWGYQVDGQFSSMEEINNYPVNIDGQGNRTLLPGDLKYKDINGDGIISGLDERPIGYGGGQQPNLNFGFTLGLTYKGFDFNADFSGASGYTWFQHFETRWAFQNGGNLNKIFEDRWHRADMYDVNSAWIPGKYPANRFNQGGHSNYNKNSTFWAHNVRYLRARTIQLGYTLPTDLVKRASIKRARFYINAYNLFSIDNVGKYSIDPEVNDDNGLQFPQMKNVNVGVNLTF